MYGKKYKNGPHFFNSVKNFIDVQIFIKISRSSKNMKTLKLKTNRHITTTLAPQILDSNYKFKWR